MEFADSFGKLLVSFSSTSNLLTALAKNEPKIRYDLKPESGHCL